MKKIVHIFLIITMFVLFACAKKNEQTIPTKDAKVAVEQTIKEETVPKTTDASVVENASINTISYDKVDISDKENGKVYQDITYTKINFSGSEVLKKEMDILNDKFKKDAEAFKANGKDEIREIIKDRNDNEAQYYYHQEVKTMRNDSKIISLQGSTDLFTMGAHGSYVVDGYNYDVATGKRLTIFDIVTSKEDLKKNILDELAKHNPDELFPEYKDTVEAYIKEDNGLELAFVITDKDVIVTFQQYDVAPYAVGLIDVVLDKNILIPELRKCL